MKIVKIKIYIGTKTTIDFFLIKKTSSFFNVKDVISYKFFFDMYILADLNEIVENKDLYSKKDDF